MKERRLFDRIMARVKDDPENLAILKHYTVFEASNVAKFYFEVSDKEYWHYVNDFPNIVPPFPLCFVEFEHPEQIISEKYGTRKWKSEIRPEAWGVMFHTMHLDSPEAWDAARKQRDYGNYLKSLKETDPNAREPRWLTKALLYMEYKGNLPYVTMSWVIGMDETGRLLANEKGPFLQISSIPWRSNEWSALMHDDCTPYFQPALLALSFMHCRNVRVEVKEPNKKFDRVQQKKGNPPLVRYRTIEIEPMKKVLRTEGRMGEVGISKAIHICRGHFKHYGEQWGTKPLFGKIEGMWWWENMIRGNPEEGAVISDYKVEPPKKAS